MNQDKESKCTLNNKELLDKCEKWIDKLCKSGGHCWTLRVPVDFNEDPDMLFGELIRRFQKETTRHNPPHETVEQWVSVNDGMPEYRHAVNIWCPENKCTFTACYYENEGWKIFGSYDDKVIREVTHWRPLPSPPKEHEDEQR